MNGSADAAADRLASALCAVLWVVSPNELEHAIRENVDPRVGKYPGEDWGDVAEFLRAAFNAQGSVSQVRRLASETMPGSSKGLPEEG